MPRRFFTPRPGTIHGRLTLASGLVGIAEVANILARLIYAVLVARGLGPEAYGRLAFAMSWTFVFLPLATGGGNFAVLRMADPTSRRVEFSRARSLTMYSSLIMATLCALLGWLGATDPMTAQLICILSLAVAGRSIAAWGEAVALVSRRTVVIPALRTGGSMVELLLVGAAIASDGKEPAVAWAAALAQVGLALVWLRIVRGETSPASGGYTAVLRLARTVFPFACSLALRSALYNGPLLLAGYLISSEVGLGVVALVLQVATLLTSIPQGIAQAATPELAAAKLQQRPIGPCLAHSLSLVTLACGIFIVGSLTVGTPLTVHLFGDEFAAASPLLVLATVNVLLIGWSLVAIQVHVASSTAWRVLAALAVSVLVMVVAQVALSPRFTLLAPVLSQTSGAIVLLVGVSTGKHAAGMGHWVSAVWRPMTAVGAASLLAIALVDIDPWLALAVGVTTLSVAAFFLLRDQTGKTGERPATRSS